MREGLANLGLALFSTTVGLVALEGAVRLLNTVRPQYDIEMWRYAVELKLPTDDDRHHVHRPGGRATIMGHDVRINSAGLRSPEVGYDKPDGVYRILSVGDSFTFGFGVGQEQTFSHLLEGKLNAEGRHVQVINTGVGNYNTIQQLSYMEIEGHKFEPDHVILNFYLNDGEDVAPYSFNPITQYLQSAVMISGAIIRLKARFASEADYRDVYAQLYDGERWERYEKVLGGVADFAEERDIPLTVVILADLRDLEHYEFEGVHDRLKDFYATRDVPVVDTRPGFTNFEPMHYWVAADDPHPNEEAHRIIAQRIFEEIEL